MSYQFVPGNAGTIAELKNYVERNLREISSALDDSFLLVPKYYAEPKSLDSMFFYVPVEATWDPGLGAGLYYYDGTTFIKVA